VQRKNDNYKEKKRCRDSLPGGFFLLSPGGSSTIFPFIRPARTENMLGNAIRSSGAIRADFSLPPQSGTSYNSHHARPEQTEHGLAQFDGKDGSAPLTCLP
jgi:hypothetical protein